jgi:hypothetical protein
MVPAQTPTSPPIASVVPSPSTMSQTITFTRGGNDRLISGINATDQMWGDAETLADSATGGHDTFVFAGTFGNDFVNDFHQHEDTLEFHVAGVADLSDLVITFDGQNTVISTTASATDTVTLVGFTGALAADDFMFC